MNTRGQIEAATNLDSVKFSGLQEPFAIETQFRWKLQNTAVNRFRYKQLLELQKSKLPFLLVKRVDRMQEFFLFRKLCDSVYDKNDLINHWTMFWKSKLTETNLDKFNSFKDKHRTQNDVHALNKIYKHDFYMCVDYPNFIKANRFQQCGKAVQSR